MILKIARNDGWKYIDGVKEIDVEPIEVDIIAKKAGQENKYYDGVFLYNHVLTDGYVDTKAMGALYTSVIEMVVTITDEGRFKTDRKPFYIADLAVYLLSDSGKTIERIN